VASTPSKTIFVELDVDPCGFEILAKDKVNLCAEWGSKYLER
jgi:hypothetical protein